MRFICLHGVGSSASICESQFAPIVKAADPSYEFVFVDGPVPSPRGPGMTAYVDGPFYSYTTGYTPNEMMAAIEHLDLTIEDQGPFDGIIGFSQGAALAISYMYHKQAQGDLIPFKFAMCFSSVMPCSADDRDYSEVIEKLRSSGKSIASLTLDAKPSLSDDEHAFCDLLLKTVVPARKNNMLLPEYDMEVYTNSELAEAPVIMHPSFMKEKIRIPTVHLIGKRDFDFMKNMSMAAFELCDQRTRKKLEHSGGHQPPQKASEIKATVTALEWAINQSEKALLNRL